MSTTPKRSNDGIIGTPAAKRPSTNTATSVSDVEWDELVFGKPFANRYDGFHHKSRGPIVIESGNRLFRSGDVVLRWRRVHKEGQVHFVNDNH